MCFAVGMKSWSFCVTLCQLKVFSCMKLLEVHWFHQIPYRIQSVNFSQSQTIEILSFFVRHMSFTNWIFLFSSIYFVFDLTPHHQHPIVARLSQSNPSNFCRKLENSYTYSSRIYIFIPIQECFYFELGPGMVLLGCMSMCRISDQDL